jgi:hypothetical protein
MQKSLFLAGLCVFYVCLADPARAGVVTGRVLCDANNNMTIDDGDVGMSGVMVTVVGEIGTYSNSAVTAADGSFSMTLPDFDAFAYRRDPLSQSYIERLSPSTLPSDAIVVFPQPALGTNPVYYISPQSTNSPIYYISLTGSSTNGDWLISSASCRAVPQTNTCRFAGSGVIRGDSNLVEHSFSGSISPKLNKKGFRQGKWTHLARALNLRFQSTEIDSVSCSQVAGISGISVVNAFDFTGRGVLRALRGRKQPSTPVFFTAHVEDGGTPGAGKDAYYFRAYNEAGDTLLLVSGDPANPENITPVLISKGNLRVSAMLH